MNTIHEDDLEQNKSFMQEIENLLNSMSEKEKDLWIISQAKILDADLQQDFIKSLKGQKKVQYMPDHTDIEKFIEKVRNGEIYIKYKSRYIEFDFSGNYIGDWEVWYNDPENAMSFLDCVFRGCHDLIVLEDYEYASSVLSAICRLEFIVEEAEESEDFDLDGSPFNLANAYGESLLKTDRNQVSHDLIYAFYMTHKKMETRKLAHDLLELLKLPICEKILPSDIFKFSKCSELLNEMILILEEEIPKNEKEIKEKLTDVWSSEGYHLKMQLDYMQEMLRDMKSMTIKKKETTASVLALSWERIQLRIKFLSYEFIDDQPDIDEIWDICTDMVKYLKDNTESWDLRKKILQDIVENEYYDYYGCSDPMNELVEVLCSTESEYIEFANIMNQQGTDYFEECAARIYQKYGHEKEYVAYLENHLAKKSSTYLELIHFYDSHNHYEKALEVAKAALDKCKEDMTDIFIYLIKDAYKKGDESAASRLYGRAKKRKGVTLNKVDEVIEIYRQSEEK